jgi:hypothetical protein
MIGHFISFRATAQHTEHASTGAKLVFARDRVCSRRIALRVPLSRKMADSRGVLRLIKALTWSLVAIVVAGKSCRTPLLAAAQAARTERARRLLLCSRLVPRSAG